ncbi:hypothetical protein TcWFU_008111 [Taenia crassiceps]|uniref:Secreted protein n=1 Tax=Taenia crassiceps TaxID=6207 RepID=A0ABR4PZ20_9CEST
MAIVLWFSCHSYSCQRGSICHMAVQTDNHVEEEDTKKERRRRTRQECLTQSSSDCWDCLVSSLRPEVTRRGGCGRWKWKQSPLQTRAVE